MKDHVSGESAPNDNISLSASSSGTKSASIRFLRI
jgi:hypothetical protein